MLLSCSLASDLSVPREVSLIPLGLGASQDCLGKGNQCQLLINLPQGWKPAGSENIFMRAEAGKWRWQGVVGRVTHLHHHETK